MAGCKDKLMNLLGYDDIDDLLSYSTPKVVKVRDYRLGALDKIFKLAIFLYIVVYAVFVQQGYYSWEEIAGGSVTFNAQTPKTGDIGQPSNYDYCCNPNTVAGAAAATGTGAYGPANATGRNRKALDDTVKWGSKPCPADKSDNTKKACAYWDELATVHPIGMDYSIAVTTRAKLTKQIGASTAGQECGTPPIGGAGAEFGYSCEVKDLKEEAETFFFPNIEYTTLLIKHGARGRNVDAQFSNTGEGGDRKKGFIEDYEGATTELPINKLQAGADPKVSMSNGDILSVHELLKHAGVYKNSDTALDEPVDGGDETSSIRYNGLNIVVYILYARSPFSQEETYTYQPKELTSVEFKVVTREQLPGNEDVYEVNRHGIRILFVQVGRIGKFSFQALLLTFVASVGLLAVSSSIVGVLMGTFMQFKNYYKFYKYELTDDFSGLRNDPEAFKSSDSTVKKINQGKLPRDAFLKDVQVKYDAMAVSQAENIAVQESQVHANQRVAEAKVGGEDLMGHTAC